MPHPHKVYGPFHPDGGDWSPLCELREQGDAHLIAAAPELRLVLKLLVNACEQPETPGKAGLVAMRVAEAKQVILKAGYTE